MRTWIDINTLRSRQNGRHFADDIFKCIFLNENIWISIKISLKLVPKGPINNIPALVQIMACRLPGDKPLSELMVASLLTHICVTRPQWVKTMGCGYLMLYCVSEPCICSSNVGMLWIVYAITRHTYVWKIVIIKDLRLLWSISGNHSLFIWITIGFHYVGIT